MVNRSRGQAGQTKILALGLNDSNCTIRSLHILAPFEMGRGDV